MNNHIVVGFKNAETSLAALRWAIDEAKRSDSQLTVVHAASIPIAVQNGPSRAAAFKMGDPTWATVHSVVQSFQPPSGTTTVVKGGRAVDVLTEYASSNDLIVLGSGPKRFFRRWSTSALLHKLGHTVRVINGGSSGSSLRSRLATGQPQPAISTETRQLVA